MADTHGVLRPEVERILETCDVIVHAGDFDNQMLYHKLNVDQPLRLVCRSHFKRVRLCVGDSAKRKC